MLATCSATGHLWVQCNIRGATGSLLRFISINHRLIGIPLSVRRQEADSLRLILGVYAEKNNT